MNLLNKAFPHPVLRPDTNDFLESSFQAVIEPLIVEDDGKKSIEFDCNFMLSNERVQSEIDANRATFAVDIDCKDTLFRVVKRVKQQEKILFPGQELYGRVEITPLIVATRPIQKYVPNDLHPEFGEAVFRLQPGDVLAFDDNSIIFVEFTKLSFESLIRVQTSSDIDAFSYSIALEGEMITIMMGEKFRSVWDELRNDIQKNPFLALSVYKDCVYMALHHLSFAEEPGETRWGRALSSKLKKSGIEISTAPDPDQLNLIAQELVSTLGIKRILDYG